MSLAARRRGPREGGGAAFAQDTEPCSQDSGEVYTHRGSDYYHRSLCLFIAETLGYSPSLEVRRS